MSIARRVLGFVPASCGGDRFSGNQRSKISASTWKERMSLCKRGMFGEVLRASHTCLHLDIGTPTSNTVYWYGMAVPGTTARTFGMAVHRSPLRAAFCSGWRHTSASSIAGSGCYSRGRTCYRIRRTPSAAWIGRFSRGIHPTKNPLRRGWLLSRQPVPNTNAKGRVQLYANRSGTTSCLDTYIVAHMSHSYKVTV